MTSNVDPRLKSALKKIEKVLDEHDCGGIVSIHSKTHTEFKFHVPKWSLVQLKTVKGGQGCVIKHRGLSDNERTEASYHLFMDAQEVCGHFFLMLEDMRKQLEKLGMTRVPFVDRP